MALNICIAKLDVNNISYLGSLNIGKTIICRNEATGVFQPAPTVPPGKELELKLGPAEPEALSPAIIHPPEAPGAFVHPEPTHPQALSPTIIHPPEAAGGLAHPTPPIVAPPITR